MISFGASSPLKNGPFQAAYLAHAGDDRLAGQKGSSAQDKKRCQDDFLGVRFNYALNGKAVTSVVGETWNDDGPDPYDFADDYTVTFAREFRYDGPRERYLVREFDGAALTADPYDLDAVLSETWSDYDGEMIYGDYEVVGGSAVEGRSYQAGIGRVEPWTSAGQASTTYYHVDMLGSTRGTSVFQNGAGSYDLAYTAFEEPAMGTPDRYGFAGAWGYQTHADFPYQHLGHRYYDPTIGRFLQRDPIGIGGGTNVYTYAGNAPTAAVDPLGLWTLGIGISGTLYLWPLPFHIQVDISVHVGVRNDGSGFSAGVTGTAGGGFGVGIGAGLSAVGTITSADSVLDLAGTATEAAVDTPVGSGSLIHGHPSNSDDPTSGYSGAQVGFGPAMPVGGARAGDTRSIMLCGFEMRRK